MERADALLAFLKRNVAVVAPVAVVLLLAASVVAIEGTSLTPFCGTCHSMWKVYGQWERSTHAHPAFEAQVGCSDCHVRDGVVGLVQDHMVNGTFQLFTEFTPPRMPARPTVTTAMHEERCQACHRNVASRDQALADDRLPPSLREIGLVVPHRNHYELRALTDGMAARLATLREKSRPSAGADPILGPDPLSRLTALERGELARLEKIELGNCAQCHEREVRRADGTAYWAKDRPWHASQPMTCMSCHKKVVHADVHRHGAPIPDRELCASCHAGEYHGKLGRIFPVQCADGVEAKDCIKCHPKSNDAILKIVTARVAGAGRPR